MPVNVNNDKVLYPKCVISLSVMWILKFEDILVGECSINKQSKLLCLYPCLYQRKGWHLSVKKHAILNQFCSAMHAILNQFFHGQKSRT